MNIERKFREACVTSGLANVMKGLNNPTLNSAMGATLEELKKSTGNTIVGTIYRIGQTVNVSKSGEFLKRELVLDLSRFDRETGQKLPNYVEINFTSRHVGDLDGFNTGEKVEVWVAIGGREWNGKIINDITGYRIERVVQTAQAAPAPQPAPQPQTYQQPAPTSEAEDFPF